MKRLPLPLQRLAIGLTLVLAFLLMASVIAPDLTRASPLPTRVSTPAHEGLSSLGTIEDDRYVVEIFTSAQGPLYSVFSADGEELGVLMTAEKAAEWFPDLPIPFMDFGTESALMLETTEYPDF